MSLFYKLTSQQPLRLFVWKCTPTRVLGFCLRYFLAAQVGSVGRGTDSMNTEIWKSAGEYLDSLNCSSKNNYRIDSAMFVNC